MSLDVLALVKDIALLEPAMVKPLDLPSVFHLQWKVDIVGFCAAVVGVVAVAGAVVVAAAGAVAAVAGVAVAVAVAVARYVVGVAVHIGSAL